MPFKVAEAVTICPTIAVSTAECETSFCLKWIKHYLHYKMSEQWLIDLAVLYIEK